MEPLELLKEDAHTLFKTAREMAKGMPTKFASRAIIDTNCASTPQCRHCRWHYFETIRPGFRRVMSNEEAVAAATKAEKEGADWLFIISGCKGDELPDFFYDRIRNIKKKIKIPTNGLFGLTGKKTKTLLKQAGLDGVHCGLESPNASILKKVRPSDDPDKRIHAISDAKEAGLKVWSGFVIGLGESPEDVARGLKLFKDMAVDAVSLSWFDPAPFTEMETENPPNHFWGAKVIAATRIYLGNIDILTNAHPEWSFRAGGNATMAMPDSREMVRTQEMRDTINAVKMG
jgi:biotin synthase